jgi:DNA-directed RNA polymerase subunit RPC12/RpoP
VTFACARCHHEFSADEDPEVCPKCGAEAGLERQKGVPVAMKLFGLLIVGVLVAAMSGGVVSRIAG